MGVCGFIDLFLQRLWNCAQTCSVHCSKVFCKYDFNISGNWSVVHDVLAECKCCWHLASLPGRSERERERGFSLFSCFSDKGIYEERFSSCSIWHWHWHWHWQRNKNTVNASTLVLHFTCSAFRVRNKFVCPLLLRPSVYNRVGYNVTETYTINQDTAYYINK